MRRYYVDSCVYLNLWKKEVDGDIQLWKLAKEFFEKAEDENSIIYYSGFLLKELMFTLDEELFIDKLEMFNRSAGFKRITLTKEEYEEAQRLKNVATSDISFFDVIYTLLAKKTNSILITRDKELSEFARSLNVETRKPEDIL